MRLTTICCKSLATLFLLAGMQAASANALDDYRVAFAHAIYAATPAWVHNRNPQPLLRAVVVLRLRLGADHHMQAEVIRSNDTQPEMLQRALATVQRAQVPAPPSSVQSELMNQGFMETWLFDNDGTFQVRTLAKPQLSS